eukprot:COSAG02_NODE_5012_length_4724_cov_73.188324_2_plen_516_part_00
MVGTSRADAGGSIRRDVAGRSAWWNEQASAVAKMQAAVVTRRRERRESAKEWLRRAHGGVTTADRVRPAPEPELEPAPGSVVALEPVVWGARAGSEWKLTQRGLEEEAERNEVNVLWRGTGPLGVLWSSLRRGGNEDDFDNGGQQLYACIRRTFPPSDSHPRAPYETTADWLRMVGKQAKDDEQHQQQCSTPTALQATGAQGFSTSFNVSTPGSLRRQSRGTHKTVQPTKSDSEQFAREQLVPGLVLHRLQGKLLDPTGPFTLTDALQPLQRLRTDTAQPVVHTSFLHDHGRYYEACFYERTLPQLHVVQPVRPDLYGASSASFGVRLALPPKGYTPQTLNQRGRSSAGEDGGSRFGWSSEMRPRLAEAAERGMVIAAIQGVSTEEWSRAEVVARLRQVWDSSTRPVRITFVARRTSAAWGGMHDRARGATPDQPLPVASRQAWEALLAAGRQESAVRHRAVSQLVAAEGRGPAVFMASMGFDSDDPKANVSLLECYKAKYGEQRPAADKDWDQY